MHHYHKTGGKTICMDVNCQCTIDICVLFRFLLDYICVFLPVIFMFHGLIYILTDQKLGQIYNEEGILLIFNKEF
jgi:hypothetical protein